MGIFAAIAILILGYLGYLIYWVAERFRTAKLN
jgi:preprotein translocase subunit Sss1